MIRGYPAQPSPVPGGRLTLHVATDAPAFRVEIYRCGITPSLMRVSDWFPGQDTPPHLPFQDWGEPGVDLRGRELAPWPAYTLPVPHDWPSGVYVAVLVEAAASGR
ncbi:MAG TPA: hypothetical protein VKP64_06775, partial [Mycobacteriales bacterium]|nr:hypothetical protein [Mycobacteriales bacterium]